MSRRMLLIAALLPGGPRSVMAQGASPLGAEVRRLERVVDSLQRRFGEVSSVAAATPEVARATSRHEELEVVTAGRLRIRTNRSPLPVARGAAMAWERLSDYFGDALARTPIATLVIQGLDPDSSAGEWDDVAELTVPWDLPADQLSSRIAELRAPPTDDPALVTWSGGAPRPSFPSRTVLERAHLDLLLSPYSLGRDCAVGAVDACLPALQLLPDPAPATLMYPTARDRRLVAEVIGRGGHGPALQPLLDRCLVAGEAEGCTAVVEAISPSARPAITDVQTRRLLLEFSLHTGGPRAYGRLLAARGDPIGERLAAAAGLPLDTLLLRWRAELADAGRGSDPWSFEILGGGVVWVVALALVAMRSSRWRVD